MLWQMRRRGQSQLIISLYYGNTGKARMGTTLPMRRRCPPYTTNRAPAGRRLPP